MIFAARAEPHREAVVRQNPVINTVNEIYKALFFDNFSKLYHYALTILKNEEEAKDVVQSAFLKLWLKRDEVDIRVAGKSYLYTTVYRLSLNAIRDRKVQVDYPDNLIASGSASNPSEIQELRLKLNLAIEKLPLRCKEVFYKSRFEGKKYSVMAGEMNISIKTVEVQMGKALKLLRENLSGFITLSMLPLII